MQALHRTVTAELGPIGADAILSWNSSPLWLNDGRGLGQVGIHRGSVIECAVAMRGGMQGTAESTAARSSAQEKLRQCKAKVHGLKTLVATWPLLSLTSPQPDPPTDLHRRMVACTWPKNAEPGQGAGAKVCGCTDVEGGWGE